MCFLQFKKHSQEWYEMLQDSEETKVSLQSMQEGIHNESRVQQTEGNSACRDTDYGLIF